MKKINFKKLAEEWFEKAREDIGVARLIFEEKSYSGSVCFHCHQAAEKYLKGFLVSRGKDIEEKFKIHNLIKLFDYCQKAEKSLNKELKNYCILLNKYYILTRYPMEQQEFSWKEVKKALAAAAYIQDKILQAVK